ncbi:MAG: periplasmic heavy metal sensor [Pseudomonadota bacterium]
MADKIPETTPGASTDGGPRRATPLWLRIVLVLSLGANLAVIGLVIGSATSPNGPRNPDRIAGDVGAAPFVRALEQEDRKALAADMLRQSGGFRQIRREGRVRAEALFAALRAPEFDRDAVESLLNQQREAAKFRQNAGEAALLDRLEGMSLQQRVAYADRLAAQLRRGSQRGQPRN